MQTYLRVDTAILSQVVLNGSSSNALTFTVLSI